ncbi:probable D-lactate dehydrogenase [cytochrome] 2, mitochondrial [Saccharomycodes ludwigii]|uniref:D-2-hydroxyglutarate dehydrogenase, mitochondrial n=1 Tax=Saccharomycodes ludwigii TaxID=36035 RepID=A0A376B5Y2_9ASCO|nr:hypothetical protein SCDLUD_000314 [Saccharomycodes ludwigii]KAH3902728.1 hypothetical protein SCDLUD_000314 [Saccharomycodes ludwigii]SSD60105.1 probable D-lactate dehydrogenase [cytochrome] 2, mitochondrial [Saccharomycodes ludwigii]
MIKTSIRNVSKRSVKSILSYYSVVNPISRVVVPNVTKLAATHNYSTTGTKIQPRLTSENYPSVKRDPRYKQLTNENIEYFKTILEPKCIIQDDLDAFNEDWMRKYKGQSKLVLKPTNTEQVSAILKYCNKQKLAVVPQGGNTGLVGGSVPVFDEIILSLSGMNKIRSFDKVSGIFKCDAGVILENADNFLAEHGYIFPLDLGAKGSCHVGGVVATNAGGLRLLRYGSLHGSVLGLEVVLPNGEVLNSLHSLRKDNTGYDLKQLFIGSEGTIGIVTGVSILCPPRPSAFNVAFLGVESYEAVQRVFIKAKKELGEILSAFEFMDLKSQQLTKAHIQQPAPLEEEHSFYILIETSGSSKEHDDAKLEQFLEKSFEDGIISDGVISQGETELHNLWAWREMIPESSQANGGVYKYDVSLPLKDLYSLVEATNERLTQAGLSSETDKSKPVISAVGYGHVGDGNLHLNVAVRQYTKEVEKCLEPFVYEFVSSKKGSISAEHGLGFQKKNYIGYTKNAQEIKMIKDLKHHYDESLILNPYKYI